MVDSTSEEQRQRASVVQRTSSKTENHIRATECFGLLQSMRDRDHRSKLLLSWLIILAFFTMGLLLGQIGATLIDLQIITRTDLEAASAFITAFTAGNMAGAFISGAVYHKINTLLLIFIGLTGAAVTTIITPYLSSYPLMIFIRALCGIFIGIIEAAGSATQMKLWRNKGRVVIQTTHFFFSIGGVIAPLYTEPFLAKRIIANETNTDNVTIRNLSDSNRSSNLPETNVHYAFLISGVILILTSLLFVAMFVKQRSPNIQNNPDNEEKIKITYRELPCCVFILILTAICVMFLLYCCVELTMSSFLMAFFINEFESISTSESVYITTVLWVSFAVSRFIMIFVSRFLSSLQLLSICIIVMLVAYTGFFIGVIFESIAAVSVFTAMTGLGMSSVFPAGISWVEMELLKVTPRVSSTISGNASIGRIIIPVIMGFLMDDVSNWWFCYILLGQTVLICLICIFLFFLNRLFLNKAYGTMTLTEPINIVHGQDQLLIKRLKEEPEMIIYTSLNKTILPISELPLDV